MATTIPLLVAAINTAIRDMTPASQAQLRFRLLEGDEDPAGVAINGGATRRFIIIPAEGEEGPYQVAVEQEMRRRLMVTVIYPTQRALNTELRMLIESDVKDLRNTLNNYLVWGSALADPQALLHAIVPSIEIPVQVQQGRLLLVLPLDVQYLESVT